MKQSTLQFFLNPGAAKGKRAKEEAEGETAGKKAKIDDETVTKTTVTREDSANNITVEKEKVVEEIEKHSEKGPAPAQKETKTFEKTVEKKSSVIPFSLLAETFQKIEEESGRLKIIDYLATTFQEVIERNSKSLLPSIYLSVGAVAPPHECIELGVGESLILKTLAEATGRSPAKLKAEYDEIGDLGNLAEVSKTSQRTLFRAASLTVESVFERFKTIAKLSGSASQNKRRDEIKRLLVAAQSKEARYIVRGLQGKLRIGLAEQSVLAALGVALVKTPPPGIDNGPSSASNIEAAQRIIRSAHCRCPSYDHLIPAVLSSPLKKLLDHVGLEPGLPIKPMLAHPTKGIAEVLQRFSGSEFTCEFKYDGERAQIHRREDGTVSIFSRNSENTTEKYPDVATTVKDSLLKTVIVPSSLIVKETLVQEPELAVDDEGEVVPSSSQKVLKRKVKISFEGLPRSKGEAAKKGEEGEAGEADENKAEGGEKKDRKVKEEETNEVFSLPPELAEALQKPPSSFIVDTEVVAYDIAEHKILPFQVLSTRARKGVEAKDILVKVCVFPFDLLYVNGVSLLEEPFRLRREILRRLFKEEEGRLSLAQGKDLSDVEEIQNYLEDAVKANCEGLMVKTLSGVASTYEPAKRSHKWLKVKKDYLEGMTDSVDLVPMGAYFGRGKRTGVFGAYLLGCYNAEDEEYQSICKIGTGFSDAMLQDLKKDLDTCVVDAPPAYYRYGDNVKADVWFEPSRVWEVKAADLSISPVHQAAKGLIDPAKGVSLRFPRLVRVRDDKGAEDATSAQQIAEMYRNQASSGPSNGGNGDDDDYF